MSAFCRSCKAEIFWCVTSAGKRMPVDAKPSPTGTLVLRTQAGDDGVEVNDEPLIAMSVKAAQELAEAGIPTPAGEPRFTSHFATCPQGRQWRKADG